MILVSHNIWLDISACPTSEGMSCLVAWLQRPEAMQNSVENNQLE